MYKAYTIAIKIIPSERTSFCKLNIITADVMHPNTAVNGTFLTLNGILNPARGFLFTL